MTVRLRVLRLEGLTRVLARLRVLRLEEGLTIVTVRLTVVFANV